MLTLIGLGLYDEKDLSLRGIDAAKNADEVFIELYTSKWHGNLKNLEKIVGKEIKILQRKDLEENSAQIVDRAKVKDIAIFVPGDPLIATVHSSLLQQAKKNGVKTKVIHNSSIISAICETGLHIYRFGSCVTIPFPDRTKGKLPESIYEIIKINRSHGLHTLCLLDILEQRAMDVKEAIEILLNLEDQRKEGIFKKDTEIVVFAKAGSENPIIDYAKVEDILKKKYEIPAVIIIPGILHFTEKEFLSKI